MHLPEVSKVLLADLFNIGQHQGQLPWQPFRPGVDIYPLYQSQETSAQLALLRYQPGASVPHHRHPGFEHILVLWGTQEDELGRYPAGTLTINPPNSHHRVASEEGCIVLIGWEKPVEVSSVEVSPVEMSPVEVSSVEVNSAEPGIKPSVDP